MSFTNCKWLPKLILRGIGESEEDYLKRIYVVFEKDFKKSQPIFKGRRVGCRKNPVTHGYEEGFFHLTSFQYNSDRFEDRVLDEDRCARFPWIRKVIENYECAQGCCSRLIIWKEKKRWKILFPDERYIVVLEERSTYYVVVTAYYIDRLHDHELNRYLHQHS